MTVSSSCGRRLRPESHSAIAGSGGSAAAREVPCPLTPPPSDALRIWPRIAVADDEVEHLRRAQRHAGVRRAVVGGERRRRRADDLGHPDGDEEARRRGHRRQYPRRRTGECARDRGRVLPACRRWWNDEPRAGARPPQARNRSMCMACEEADMAYRWQLVEHIAKGEMPPGLTAQDLDHMGLPQPGEIEVTQEPGGTMIYRQKAPTRESALRARAASSATPRTRNDRPHIAYACARRATGSARSASPLSSLPMRILPRSRRRARSTPMCWRRRRRARHGGRGGCAPCGTARRGRSKASRSASRICSPRATCARPPARASSTISSPPYELTVTANLWRDGAVMLGKLNNDEFAMGSVERDLVLRAGGQSVAPARRE